MLHCKSCRNNRADAEFMKDSKQYKTCNLCRVAKGKRRFQTLDDCQQLAESRGGLCLSKTYTNYKTKLLWQCEKQHQWEASFASIKQKQSWCPQCSGNVRLTIEECREFAESKNGKCLSENYVQCDSKMEWQCDKKHQWEATFHSIKSGQWCAHCAGNVKLTIEECQQFAESKNGKCISDEYVSTKSKLTWECEKQHQWRAKFKDIKNKKSWCPYCQEYRSEKLCREILEQYTGLKFIKIRPEWLDRLELDGYNAEYNMAFEYNGCQHYEYVPHFHRNSIADFHSQQERDEKKYKLCDTNKVQLIIIPHTFSFQKPQELEDFIVSELDHLMF